MQKGERLRHRQPPARQQQMTAAQRSQLLRSFSGTETLGPRACGHGQHSGAQLQHRAALAIFDLNPTHAPGFTQQLHDPHTIEHHRAVSPGLAQYAHHQPRIIGQCIDKTAAAEQTVFPHARRQISKLLRIMKAMAASSRQGVVNAQQTTQHPRPGKATAIVRHHETHRLDQPRRFVEQALTLAHRIAGQAPLALGDVSQTAVDHFRRSAGGAPGKIPLLQQQTTPAPARRFADNPGTADAAADDDQVPGFIRQRRQHLLAPLRVPVRIHGFDSGNSVPGLRRPSGSKCLLSVCNVCIASGPFSRSRYGA